MVSFTLKFMFFTIVLMALVQYKLDLIIHPPVPKVILKQIEVGKTLALARMRRAGVEGDWHDYTTWAIYGIQPVAA